MVEKKERRINDITDIKGISAQMRTVYRLARLNVPDKEVCPQTAKTLVDILKTITVNYRESELETRIKALEEKQN